MKKMSLLLIPLVSIFVVAAVCLRAYGAHATSTTTAASCNWRVVASPNPATGKNIFNTLNGVAAVSANNVWAVGSSEVNGSPGSPNQAIIEHWNGTKWQLSKPAQASFAEFNGVVALAANNVWAVGDNGSTLIEHWGGSAWSVVPSPSPSMNGDFLKGVSAVSANDIWAVGFTPNNNSNTSQTLIEHWDGHSWKVVSSPNVGTLPNTLSGVKAIASNNVWAVGDTLDTQTNIEQPLVEHWDGTSWKIVSTPAITSAGLSAITAKSASDAWAVGVEWLNGNTNSHPLIEHWNGTAWSIVTGPTPGLSQLNGVSALSATDVWAVGAFNFSSGGSQTLVEHWDGTSWATVTSPNPTSFSFLNAVAAVTATHIWAVGKDFVASGTDGGRTLTETQC